MATFLRILFSSKHGNFCTFFPPENTCTLKISVKSGKDNTSTLSLVIYMVRFLKNLEKSTLAFKGGRWGWEGLKLRKPSILMVPEFHAVFLFFWTSPLLLNRFSLPPTCTSTIIPLEPCALNAEIQHFVLSFSILYWDLIKLPHFTDTTKRGVRGVKGGPKTRVKTADISTLHQISFIYLSQSQKHWPQSYIWTWVHSTACPFLSHWQLLLPLRFLFVSLLLFFFFLFFIAESIVVVIASVFSQWLAVIVVVLKGFLSRQVIALVRDFLGV